LRKFTPPCKTSNRTGEKVILLETSFVRRADPNDQIVSKGLVSNTYIIADFPTKTQAKNDVSVRFF